jgi:hypothetical protein
MKTLKENVISELHWENALTYLEYKKLIFELLKIKKTTGSNHTEKMIEYTQLNEKRMNKWDKITTINDALKTTVKSIKTKQNWLILTEAWCGDASQNIPVIQKMTELNENIEIRYLLRDENLDIMDAYLTDGARSIPKLIILDENFNELAQWGPRPEPVKKLLKDYKANITSHDEFALLAHAWYGKDRGNTLQGEFLQLLSN